MTIIECAEPDIFSQAILWLLHKVFLPCKASDNEKTLLEVRIPKPQPNYTSYICYTES
jgi:hypothetical protein